MSGKWDEMALVGRVARPHGLRGQMVVNPETDFPEERFQAGATLFVKGAGSVESRTITSVRFHRDRPVIGLNGVEDMNAAKALAGAELRVPVESLKPLPEGTFYRHDLVGCRVEVAQGGELGIVTAVEGTLGGSRLVVKTPKGDVLVPLAVEICPTIDPAAKRIVVNVPDGLLELNT